GLPALLIGERQPVQLLQAALARNSVDRAVLGTPPRRRQRECGRRCVLPFLVEDGPIALHLATAIDSQPQEGAATEVVHEGVEGHQQPEACLAGAEAEVVVVQEAQAIAFVEAANALQDLPADQEAEADQAVDGQGLPLKLPPPPGGERTQLLPVPII